MKTTKTIKIKQVKKALDESGAHSQFNIQKKVNAEGVVFWAVEFDRESCWKECTLWASGDEALAIARAKTQKELDCLLGDYESDWDEEYTMYECFYGGRWQYISMMTLTNDPDYLDALSDKQIKIIDNL